jgi:hypothetical protein
MRFMVPVVVVGSAKGEKAATSPSATKAISAFFSYVRLVRFLQPDWSCHSRLSSRPRGAVDLLLRESQATGIGEVYHSQWRIGPDAS